MMMETTIKSLGPGRFPSPLRHAGAVEAPFRDDSARVLHDHRDPQQSSEPRGPGMSFEAAGPREELFFNPAKTTAAIVTCGGLCPGLNDIIRGLVTQLPLPLRGAPQSTASATATRG